MSALTATHALLTNTTRRLTTSTCAYGDSRFAYERCVCITRATKLLTEVVFFLNFVCVVVVVVVNLHPRTGLAATAWSDAVGIERLRRWPT